VCFDTSHVATILIFVYILFIAIFFMFKTVALNHPYATILFVL